MAHKHSRRRQRPRSRNHDLASFGFYQAQPLAQPAYYDPTSFTTSVPANLIWNTMYPLQKQSPFAPLNTAVRTVVPKYGSVATRPRRAVKVATKTPEPILMGQSELEEEQIKLFGGEPGDDPNLCFKMLEAFGRMEWIDG